MNEVLLTGKSIKPIKNFIQKYPELKQQIRVKAGIEFPQPFKKPERDDDEYYEEEIPAITPLELKKYLDQFATDDETSFNDDETPPSEEEFLSSEYFETDVEGYIPPITKTKEGLIIQLVPEQIEDDDDFKTKVEERKRRKEIIDKKLYRPFYYVPYEHEVFIKLLEKRRRAIKRKNIKYSTDPEIKEQLINRYYVDVARIQECPLFEKNEEEEIYKISDSSGESSFDDTEVPSSELEFISDMNLDLPNYYTKPLTRRKSQLNENLNKYEIDKYYDSDEMIQNKRKMRINAIERFRESIIRQRYKKARKRLELVKKMGTNDPSVMANELMKLELKDKKLNNPFYYQRKKSIEFKLLLGKRKRAIIRKYRKYAKDEKFRDKLELRIMNRLSKKMQINKDNTTVPFYDETKDVSYQYLERKLERRRDLYAAGVHKANESAPGALCIDEFQEGPQHLNMDYDMITPGTERFYTRALLKANEYFF